MYELCLLLVCKVRLMDVFIYSLVEVTPTGPLYIAINTSRTIYCSVPVGGILLNWNVVFQNSTIVNAYDFPGIKIIRSATSSSLTINTMDTSIIGLQCIGIVDIIPTGPLIQNVTRINLTIYGELIL